MNQFFLKRPLSFQKLQSGKGIAKVDLQDSITQNLHLIISTRFSEHKYDPSFGCEIWEVDFELIVSQNSWEEKLRKSLVHSIALHEHRLAQVDIAVKISEILHQHYSKKSYQIKKQVDVAITGIMKKTGEPYQFKTKLFLSPLSLG